MSLVLNVSAVVNTIFLSSFSSMTSMPYFHEIIKENFDMKHMVYIPTAAYCLDVTSSKPIGEQRRRARYDAKQKAQLLSKAFNIPDFSLLELDSPNLSEEIIIEQMKKASMIYVDGGNTFYLQRHILESSFWKVIDPYLEKGCLYVGASAGAIVACNNIRTALWKGWDDPSVAGKDFEWNDQTLSGRKLQDYSIFMHYNEAEHGELVSIKSNDLNHNVNVLRNNEALMHFNGDKKGVLISNDVC